MRILARSTLTALLCGIALFAADALFRASLLDYVRPIVLTPLDLTTTRPPVRLSWEGPAAMEVLLSAHDEEPRSLGVHTSPFDIGAEQFPRPGGYEVRIRHERWKDWVSAQRFFQIHPNRNARTPTEADVTSPVEESRALMLAFDAARKARDKARARVRALRKDNASLSSEAERLAERIDDIYATQVEDDNLIRALEAELVDAVAEIRMLREQNVGLSMRLATVNPCTAWGYFTVPVPQTVPPTLRLVRVSDNSGNIFRTDVACEGYRRADHRSRSGCFCVGDTWAGS